DGARPLPQPALADLGGLSTGADVVEHPVRLSGDPRDLTGLDDLVSREAYQIVAEAVVNGQRHGEGPVDVTWQRRDGTLTIEVSNAGGHRHSDGGGRGLTGM